MKHVKDAKILLDQGDSAGAMTVLDNLLGLAPRNPEALRLKAEILEGWGRFDDSLSTLHNLSQTHLLDDDAVRDLERCASEEKEALIFSELTSEGRWYYAFPKAQIWISLYGFFGCAAFLFFSSEWLLAGTENLGSLATLFVVLVLVPWFALIFASVTGVKRVFIGLGGIRVCTRFREKNCGWSEIQVAVVEYDSDLRNDHLKLRLFSSESRKEPLFVFDISRGRSIVRARRHFVRNILNYVDLVCYVSRGKEHSEADLHKLPHSEEKSIREGVQPERISQDNEPPSTHSGGSAA